MFCKNCGAENKEDSKFCTSCGTELVGAKKKTTKKKEEKEEKLTYQQEGSVKPEEKVVEEKVVEAKPVTTNTEPKKEGNGKAVASLVLGICSFVIFCLMWPLSLIGLILGIASKKSGMKVAGIIINALALALSTLVLIWVFILPIFAVGSYDSSATRKNTNFFDQLEERMKELEKEIDEDTKIETKDEEKKDVKKVGDDTFGYVEVPEKWIEFHDVDASTQLIQYTDIGELGYIVTLNVYEEDIDAETAAKNLYNHIKEEGNDSYYLTTYVAGYRGYIVRSKYTDGTYLDIYLFKASDDKLHYVAIEGPDKYNENFNIPKTFSMTK